MTAMRRTTGVMIATAAAALFATGAVVTKTATADVAKYQCTGINACKGQGSCKQASHSCKGQNSCKGQGWLPVDTKGECIVKGGQVQS